MKKVKLSKQLLAFFTYVKARQRYIYNRNLYNAEMYGDKKETGWYEEFEQWFVETFDDEELFHLGFDKSWYTVDWLWKFEIPEMWLNTPYKHLNMYEVNIP